MLGLTFGLFAQVFMVQDLAFNTRLWYDKVCTVPIWNMFQNGMQHVHVPFVGLDLRGSCQTAYVDVTANLRSYIVELWVYTVNEISFLYAMIIESIGSGEGRATSHL